MRLNYTHLNGEMEKGGPCVRVRDELGRSIERYAEARTKSSRQMTVSIKCISPSLLG